ncbi:glycosyltransferase family 4 protein [Clostridium transplantifaecale]|uniref:glycosyltransferase family 4 protein n=1 Tax=Clostridium transplantifaecale TaxID=2479838 RepID=UPI000F64367E
MRILLPTFADTYGYSLLEMQACGLPVVSTNVRAMPEINDNECGWIAKLPVNEYGEALYSTEQSRNKMKMELRNELLVSELWG